MRIALLAPLITPIAPPFVGGAQVMLRDLAAGLAMRGHEVTLYATPGSHVTGVRLIPVEVEGAPLTPARFSAEGSAPTTTQRAKQRASGDVMTQDTGLLAEAYAFMNAYRLIASHAHEHDLLHAHAFDWGAYAYGSLQPLPVLHTLHLPAVDPDITTMLGTLAPPSGERISARLATVSHACAATYAPYCRIDAVIYNGIDVAAVPFGAQPAPEQYLLYAGRITPEKGVEDAIEIAVRSGHRLLLAGGIYDEPYYATRIAPRIAASDGAVTYLGPLEREHLWGLMAGALAVLCPVHWDEPFGLVACEALAAGAPVVGYARGGLREVVADGETGWLVAPDDLDAAVAALGRVATLDRAACRARVERLFSLDAMLTAYEALYTTVAAVPPSPLRGASASSGQ